MEGRRIQERPCTKTQKSLIVEEEKERYPYHIGCLMFKQSTQSLVQEQAGIEKLIIGMRIDSDDNDPETNKGATVQTYGVGISPKETTVTIKERPKLQVEVKAKLIME